MIQAQPNAPNEAIVQYQYDADDRRIARIETPRVNGIPQTPITTRSIYDDSNLLHEADPAQITATYRRSAVLDRHIDHATNTVRHYQLDALRTPVAMTDAAGNTVTATTFDAWGNPTQQTAAGATTIPWSVPQYNPRTTGQAALLNNDGQSIGFTGYQKDSATGLYYAGARFYDPLMGGFNGMDPAAGIANNPMSFHRYMYGNANPLIYIDPTGRIALLADGANMIGSWNNWLSERTTQMDSGKVGGAVSFGVGIGRGFLMLTEGAVRGVNAGVNVGVLASASAVSTFTGTAPEYAEGAANELMGTHAAAIDAVNFVRDDGLFKTYDAAVIRTGDAIQGDNQAISDITAMLTTLAAPAAARGTTGSALTQNIQQRAQQAYESARSAAAAHVQSLKNAVRKPAVMTESANGPAQPRFNDIDSEFGAVNQPVRVLTGETATTKIGRDAHKAFADERRQSGLFDVVNQPITDAAGNSILVPKRYNLRTGDPSPDAKLQTANPDAVSYKRSLLIDDKPLGRPLAKDRQEILRNLDAYFQREGNYPGRVVIQRYDPATGKPVVSELYTAEDFLPKQ